MEPITHLMTGACLARAGFNRKAAYAAVAMTVAAELPDIDTLWSVAGPLAAFQHHRGWTHTLLGLPLEAGVWVGALWLWHGWRTRRRRAADLDVSSPARRATSAPPVRWGLLFGFVLIALLSHLLLDWTNNYGLRPFFPFNPRWYAGSLVFIFEPVLFVLLLGALVAPLLFGLIGSEVGAQKARFKGRGWAIAALLGMVALWGWRAVEQHAALQLAAAADFSSESNAAADADLAAAPILRIAASPHPINPFRWHIIVETPLAYRLAVADTLTGTVTSTPGDVFYKPPTTIATLVAKRSWLGEVYLDWSKYPLVTEQPRSTDPGTPENLTDAGLTTVTFRDLRFMYDVPFMKGRSSTPLSGAVTLNEDRKVVRTEMDGRLQR